MTDPSTSRGAVGARAASTALPHLPDVAPIRDGDEQDWSAIDAYLRARMPDLDGALEVLQFPNGAANLTYLLRYGTTELVLRRQPNGTIAPGAHDMKREFKVLSRLWKYTHLAPRAYVLCEDKDVAGADWFVMERRTGEVIRGVIPPSMQHHADVGRRVGLALVDAMADLHRLDPVACELGDLGKPEGFIERQVAGWKKRWDLARPDDDDGAMDALFARLSAAVPAMTGVSFVHNDLKMDNCQFDPGDPDHVKSIFDWDMTTLGDPLIDLGTLVHYWPDVSDPGFAQRASQPGLMEMGLPSRAEIIERYAARTGTDVGAIGWWTGFAFWKTAVVTQQLYNRFRSGANKDPRIGLMGQRVPLLAEASAAALANAGS